ncbi:mechanosensitive ion channel [Verticiella sediminum]|uniref:Mechanosensitive ion channel n=1 Tax=Verticiella sediminum TaxID=1247510 RepID=A0A556ACC1_9BURK|nr:mechanosensitive ion channel domain-containing protein [Verticiella sediminum]TSH90528.1 mechanosensitive ion channel [Verticiella sediminum]
MAFEWLSDPQRELVVAWAILIGVCCAALLAAYAAHRALHALLRRLTAQRAVATQMLAYTGRASRVVLMLFAVRLVLGGAPRELAGLAAASQVLSMLFIAAVTWFAIRCVHAMGASVAARNPYEVADNLKARRILTQTRVLVRSATFVLSLIGLSFMLLTLPGARQIGASLLASAGIVGLVAGIAAQPVLGNFIAGLQIAFSQPIRIDDVLIVEGEWGRVEEITGTFVVVRVWDERRLIVPLRWFIENPFQNWTHRSASILGTVFLWLDFSVPTEAVRAEFERVCKGSQLWDGRVCVMHITDASERAMQVRLLMSARDSGTAFELRCAIREAMIGFCAQRYPDSLPRLRTSFDAPRSEQEPTWQTTA